MGGMKWIIEIYPCGHNKADKESKSVIVFLTLLSVLSEDISKMTVCWTLYSRDTMASYTSISQFTQKNNSFGFCAGILSQDELKNVKNSFGSKAVIGAKLTILNRQSAKDLSVEQVYPLRFSNGFAKKCKFEWKVDEQMLIKMKTAYNGKYFESEMFCANMWSLRCAPNGDKKDDEGTVDLMLQCNAFPEGVGKMKVVFCLKCIETETIGLFVHNFNVTKSSAGWNGSAMVKKTDIEALDTLTFAVSIHVQLFYDHKNKRIKTV